MEKSKAEFDKLLASFLAMLNDYMWLIGFFVLVVAFTLLSKI